MKSKIPKQMKEANPSAIVPGVFECSEKQLRRTGDSPLKGPYEAQSVPADDSQEIKLTDFLNNCYDEVITCLAGVDSIHLFGPGEAKGEL